MCDNFHQSSKIFTEVSSPLIKGPDIKYTQDSKTIEDIKKALENNDKFSAKSITLKYLKDINNIPLIIAITGGSGAGKSTFLNGFLAIDNKDEKAAPTGVVETTLKPEAYSHPKYQNVTLWDLPGIGTKNNPADRYLKDIEFEKFDFFIVVSADRFTENDAKLAKEIKKIGKNFYFVRSKIDNNLRDAKRSQREYDEEKTLQEIKKNCIEGLKKEGVASPQVFLVSSFDLHLFDFPALWDTIEGNLPSLKGDVLILALPNICKGVINKKKVVFRSLIKYHALLSALIAAVPIPGISIAADSGILVNVLQRYLNGFGLDEKSLEKLSNARKWSMTDLRKNFECHCSGKNVTKELVVLMLQSGLVAAGSLSEDGIRFIPVLGIPIAAALSFCSIYTFLSSILDTLSVDAEYILTTFMLNDSDEEQ